MRDRRLRKWTITRAQASPVTTATPAMNSHTRAGAAGTDCSSDDGEGGRPVRTAPPSSPCLAARVFIGATA